MKSNTVQKILGLSSADEIERDNDRKVVAAQRPGALAPVSLGESLVHAAADAALDRLNAALGVSPAVRDSFLSGPDGGTLRNMLRRYVIHANTASMEGGS